MKKYITALFFITGLISCNNRGASLANAGADTTSAVHKTVTTTPIPATSIFNVTDTFQTQNKKDFVLASLSGKPTVVAMIFTNCGYACPRLTSDMKNIAGKLKDRDKVNFMLVSFDTERDNPDQLQWFAKKMGLGADWILLHGSESSVRTLSVLLNVQFEKDAEGNFSHSNLITVLDKNGVLVFQKEGLEGDYAEMVGKIEGLR